LQTISRLRTLIIIDRYYVYRYYGCRVYYRILAKQTIIIRYRFYIIYSQHGQLLLLLCATRPPLGVYNEYTYNIILYVGTYLSHPPTECGVRYTFSDEQLCIILLCCIYVYKYKMYKMARACVCVCVRTDARRSAQMRII